MKNIISLIILIGVLIFSGCGGVDSKSNSSNNGDTTILNKVTKETTVSYDKLGRVNNENNIKYNYDENGNIASIEGDKK